MDASWGQKIHNFLKRFHGCFATRLWTHIVNSKKHHQGNFKKTVDDVRKWSMHKQSKMNQNKNENTHTSQ